MGCRACSKDASGRPGASEGKARTCAHATQREPVLAEENWSAEVSRDRVLPLGLPVCASHLLGTRRLDKSNSLHSNEGRTRPKPAIDHKYSMLLHRNQQTQTNSQAVERSRQVSFCRDGAPKSERFRRFNSALPTGTTEEHDGAVQST